MPPIISWLKGLGLGLRFEPQPIYLLTQDTTRIAGKGGGLAIFETLRDKALALGGKIRYDTTAVGLLRDQKGAACGLEVVRPDGRTERVTAGRVLLASGGFQGNPK